MQGKLLSRTVGWCSVKSACSVFLEDILWWAAFIQGFHFSLEADDWLSRPSSSVPRCCEMELLSRSLKIFLSLPRTTPGARSVEMAQSFKIPLENYGVWADRVANMNKENCPLFPLKLNVFGGFFVCLLTTYKLIQASCHFTLKHEVACWCKGKQSLWWLPWKHVLCIIGYQPWWSCQNNCPPMSYRLFRLWEVYLPDHPVSSENSFEIALVFIKHCFHVLFFPTLSWDL